MQIEGRTGLGDSEESESLGAVVWLDLLAAEQRSTQVSWGS